MQAMSSVDLTSAEMKLNNATSGSGGAIAVWGGGRLTDVGSSPNVTCERCRFTGNRAALGGAVGEKCATSTDTSDAAKGPCPGIVLGTFTVLEVGRV